MKIIKTKRFMRTQFITNDRGNKIAVILPINKYSKMMEELEELEDIRLYDEAKKDKSPSVAFDDYLKARKKRKHA